MGDENINISKMQLEDHSALIRLEGKVDNLTTAVQQSNVVLSAQLSKNTDDLTLVKLDVDRLKTGLSFTRWVVGLVAGAIGLVVAVYEAFFKR